MLIKLFASNNIKNVQNLKINIAASNESSLAESINIIVFTLYVELLSEKNYDKESKLIQMAHKFYQSCMNEGINSVHSYVFLIVN